jgi:hypothetical protein
MPDITKGKTFTDGDTVDAGDMNSIIDLAVINNDAITESKIASGAVVNDTVSAAANIVLSKLASGTDGQIPVCNASGVPTYVTVAGDATISNLGGVTLATDSVVSTNITDLNVTTVKLADDAVTAAKLADTAVTPAEYTSATVTIDQQGRITAASSGAGGAASFEFEVITGSKTWTKPTGATLIRVTAIGGGGGAAPGGAGGDGGAVVDWIDVSLVSSVVVTVGTGGAGTGSGAGTAGGNTTFGSYLTANGGGGGDATSGALSSGTVSGSQATAEGFSGLVTTHGDGGASGSASGLGGACVVQVMG